MSTKPVNSVDIPPRGDRNADPITEEPGAHPVEVGVGAEVRLGHEEALRPGRPCCRHQRRVLLDKGRAFRLVGLDQPLLRRL